MIQFFLCSCELGADVLLRLIHRPGLAVPGDPTPSSSKLLACQCVKVSCIDLSATLTTSLGEYFPIASGKHWSHAAERLHLTDHAHDLLSGLPQLCLIFQLDLAQVHVKPQVQSLSQPQALHVMHDLLLT